MKFITESDLREMYRKGAFTTYEMGADERLTPGARQFLQDRQINVFADGSSMHVGDGTRGGVQVPTVDSGGKSRNKRFDLCLEAVRAQCLLTASDLMALDMVLSQEILKIDNYLEEVPSAIQGKAKLNNLEFTPCEGMCEENFSSDLGDCFKINNFYVQATNGRIILHLNLLRSKMRELQFAAEESTSATEDVKRRLNQITNKISQLICKACGGQGCQRTE